MEIDEDLAEVIGMHLGDGCISCNKRYKEAYIGGDLTEEKDYHNNWVSFLYNKKIVIPLTGKKMRYKEYHSTGVYGCYMFDCRIVDFFNSLGIKSGSKINAKIPEEILKHNELAKRFLRGLFDTDGNIYFDRNRSAKYPINNQPRIKMELVSKGLFDQVFTLLIKLGFHPGKVKPYKGKRDKNFRYVLSLYRREDIRRFIGEIGFKNPKHYTKWQVYSKFGYCPPRTSLSDRRKFLKQKSL